MLGICIRGNFHDIDLQMNLQDVHNVYVVGVESTYFKQNRRQKTFFKSKTTLLGFHQHIITINGPNSFD